MLFSYENLYRQYLACRRNKRNTANALRFEVRLEQNLLELAQALGDRSYTPARSVCFYIQRPKLREVFAADFRDRVVHHVLVDYLQRHWERAFIHDSYACRRGKGVHAGVDRLQGFLRQVTANATRQAWYLQLDIRNYFMRIDKARLFARLAPKIDDDDALWLTRLLVFHDCTTDFVVKGDPRVASRVPSHKTLRACAPDKGLPIGNLNSQFFANVYLDALDQFVKHRLKCRHYLRYCDDFVLLSTSREQLVEWHGAIAAFLESELALELNPARTRLRPVSDGIDFLGYIVHPHHRLVRRRVVNHCRARLDDFQRRLVREAGDALRYSFARSELDRLQATLASYQGHFAKANSNRLAAALRRHYPFLDQYLPERAYPDGSRLVARRVSRRTDFRRVAQQYRHFSDCFPDDLIAMQVGAFVEFYAPFGDRPPADPGTRRMRANRRGARGGFPLAQWPWRLAALLRQGIGVVLVGETGNACGPLRERWPVARWAPRTAVPRQPVADASMLVGRRAM